MDGLTASKASPSISDPQDAVTTVVQAVAETKDVSPLDLEPLANALDPSVLEKIVADDGARRRVEFEYAGCEVLVTGDGEVSVDEQR